MGLWWKLDEFTHVKYLNSAWPTESAQCLLAIAFILISFKHFTLIIIKHHFILLYVPCEGNKSLNSLEVGQAEAV